MKILLAGFLMGVALVGGSGATNACGAPVESVWCCCQTWDGRTCCNESGTGCGYIPGCYCA